MRDDYLAYDSLDEYLDDHDGRISQREWSELLDWFDVELDEDIVIVDDFDDDFDTDFDVEYEYDITEDYDIDFWEYIGEEYEGDIEVYSDFEKLS